MTNTRDPNHLGDSFMFPPHVIDDIHIKAELGRRKVIAYENNRDHYDAATRRLPAVQLAIQ